MNNVVALELLWLFLFFVSFFFREGERCKTSFATEKIEESELQTAIKVKFKKKYKFILTIIRLKLLQEPPKGG